MAHRSGRSMTRYSSSGNVPRPPCREMISPVSTCTRQTHPAASGLPAPGGSRKRAIKPVHNDHDHDQNWNDNRGNEPRTHFVHLSDAERKLRLRGRRWITYNALPSHSSTIRCCLKIGRTDADQWPRFDQRRRTAPDMTGKAGSCSPPDHRRRLIPLVGALIRGLGSTKAGWSRALGPQ